MTLAQLLNEGVGVENRATHAGGLTRKRRRGAIVNRLLAAEISQRARDY